MILSSVLAGLPSQLNPLSKVRDELLRQGRNFTDLVSGNVTRHGMVLPSETLDEIDRLSRNKARVYEPDPLGQLCARQAVADYYGQAGLVIAPGQILLTPGTSVSYFYCFKLLAELGDEILCPSPSYPLFDMIARMAGVRVTYYRLRESHGWEIDLDYLESQLTTRTRAIVLISPHNPTGMVASSLQLRELAEITARHQLPIIADEVFSEFLFDRDFLPRPAQHNAPLVLTLNGFSKMFALPGMKLGWVAVTGDPDLVRKALWTLEMLSDTFLPVNETVQFSVPGIFRAGREFLLSYRSWVGECRDIAVKAFSGRTNLHIAPPQGGFYLTLRLMKEERSEDSIVIDLLQNLGILVHPGYFYDIAPTHLVMTFVSDPSELKPAVCCLAERLGC